MPKVSVVLPVHNAPGTIHRAIDSILAQEFTNWELVIVNDGSTDDTLARLKDYEYEQARVYSIPHSGVARALNFGIKMARGEYIARMDADDVSHPQRLKEQVLYLDSHPGIGLVSSLVQYGGDRRTQPGYAHYVDTINDIVDETDILNRRFAEAPFPHPSVMFRGSLFYQYGGYSEAAIPEDFELWLRWLHHGVKIGKLAKNLLTWYDDAHRLSRTHAHYAMDSFFKVKAHYFKKWYTQHPGRPKLWVFGAGKEVNKRARHFEHAGLRIDRFIDVRRRADLSKFIYYEDIPRADGTLVILSMVSDRSGKGKIIDFLKSQGYQEGTSFFMMV